MISDFEETLMWTSYRYAIGRKTYVSCLSYEIPQHYYKKLSKEKREFTALDIRKEILNHLAFMPFSLSITRWNSEDEYNPLETIFNFIEKENIQSWEEFSKYRDIIYNSHTNEYKYTKVEVPMREYCKYDLDDLICWETCASCFDESRHKIYKGKEYFKTWREKLIPAEKPGWYKNASFGYEAIWINLESFLQRGKQAYYILDSEMNNEKIT